MLMVHRRARRVAMGVLVMIMLIAVTSVPAFRISRIVILGDTHTGHLIFHGGKAI